MKRKTAVLAALFMLIALPVKADWVERSDQITLDVLRAYAEFQPEALSYYGLSEFDGEISRLDARAREERLASNRKQVARLKEILEKEQHPQVRQDIAILITSLEDANYSSELNHARLLPYYNLHELLFYSFSYILDARNDPSRYPAAVERMRKYAGVIDGYTPITELAKARTLERVEVPGLLGPYVGELERDVESGPRLVAGMRSLMEAYELQGWEEDFALLETQLEDYRQWLITELKPRARPDNQLPAELYADNLKQYGVRAQPDELISLARYSYQLLYSEMRALARQIATERGWEDDSVPGVITALKQDQIPADEVLPLYKDRLAKLEEIIRREAIVSLPKREASIRLATEAESAASPASFMRPPQLIGNTGQFGEFVLVQSNPALGEESRMDDFSHDAVVWFVTAHEARPGHELQFARMVEDGVSLARAIYAANSANIEGWGLYAESLVHEYLPLEAQFFSLYSRAWRAARMFLDPMVNTGAISRDEARDFLMQHLQLSLPMASSEADRYAFRAPGQATSYYYGYVALLDLRTELEIALGKDFNQLAFHDFVLMQGVLPPELLREAVLEKFLK